MSASQHDLESIAATVADGHAVDWAELVGSDAAAHAGLRQLAKITEAFRSAKSKSDSAPPHATAFRFAGLDVIEKIGEGAQGEIWRAHDRLLDQYVALKLQKKHAGVLSSEFMQEARKLAKVNHPNVVRIFGAAVEDTRAGIWMEWVQGRSLKTLLDNNGPFCARDVIVIALQLCEALAAIHRQGFAHADLKPENVLREDSGRIVLLDFGAARDFQHVAKSTVAGTPIYVAPEILDGGDTTPASDIYALSMLMFHLLSGRFPDREYGIDNNTRTTERLDTDAETQQRPLRSSSGLCLRKIAPQVSKPLAALVARGLSVNATLRPQNAEYFATLLRPLRR
ncbi:serine/threonine-protein kinase [Pseudolysobacter antarcticus]|nr:serine/threonine-protein kinase [Pseudolysobacter antarcticus]